MGLLEVILIGVALSADAMSVTLSEVFANPDERIRRLMMMPVAFGLFQFLMPLAGYLAGSVASSFLERYAGVVSFAILGVIGANMIRSSLRGDESADEARKLSVPTVLLQAVATSIDAFAVGVSFVAQGIAVVPAAAVIGVCTFVLCCGTLLVGSSLARKLGSKAEMVGGCILVLIGVKSLFG